MHGINPSGENEKRPLRLGVRASEKIRVYRAKVLYGMGKNNNQEDGRLEYKRSRCAVHVLSS